jgi:hypothetical protein
VTHSPGASVSSCGVVSQAKTIAHPECPKIILEHADFVGGTEGMLKYVAGFAQPPVERQLPGRAERFAGR